MSENLSATEEPATEEPRSILQLVLIDETGDSYYRMRWPGHQLAEQAPNWRVVSLDARAEERLTLGLEADLLIVYQSNDIDLLPLIKQRRALGKKTLAEYNDNFYDPPPASPVFGAWSSPLIWQSYERIMSECDGVIVTGPGLKRLFSKSVPKDLHVLENHLPFTPPDFEQSWKEISGEIHFGWGGSLGHIADFVSTLPTLRRLIDEEKKLHFNIMGNDALPGLLEIPKPRFSYTGWGSMAQYHAFWQPIHLGFAPLIDTPYNQCRSDIKAVEMASHAVLPILQDALPYKDFIKKTEAPHFNNTEELYEIVKRFLKSPKLLKEQTKRCYEYVREERVGLKRDERLELYSSMCPSEPSQAQWDVGTGYHEIQGTVAGQLKFGAVLKEAQVLTDQNKRTESLSLIRSALEENEFTPELALAELNTLRALKSPELLKTINRFIERFPRDWRFLLFRLVVAVEKDKEKYWRDLLSELLQAPAAVVNFFYADIVKLFVRHLVRFPALHGIGMGLLEVIEDSAELRFQMAVSLERRGEFKEARKHFSWLLKEKKSVQRNADYLMKLEHNFLKTWDSALEVRTKTGSKAKAKAKPKNSNTSKSKKASAKKKPAVKKKKSTSKK